MAVVKIIYATIMTGGGRQAVNRESQQRQQIAEKRRQLAPNGVI